MIDIDFDTAVHVEHGSRMRQQTVTGVSLHVDAPLDLCTRLSAQD